MLNRSLTISISILIGTFVLSASAYWFGTFDMWQEKVIDRLFIKHPADEKIVIVGIDEESIQKIGQWPWPRAVFAKVLPVFTGARSIGFDINFAENSRAGGQDDSLFKEALKNSKVPAILPIQVNRNGRVEVRPLALFEEVTQQGFVNVPNDPDGITRRSLLKIGEHQSFASLFANNDIKADSFRINYRGPAGTFLTIPFIDVYEKRVPERVFDNAIVLIGATAKDLHDFIETPFGSMPGVEVHANVISTLREGQLFAELPKGISLLLLGLLNILPAFLILRIHKFRNLLSSLIALLVLVNLGSIILFFFKIIIPILYLDLGFLVTSGVLILFQYTQESKEKRYIRKTFQYYLNPEIIDELIQNPQKLALGGESKKVTIFFSDIRGFTAISEAMSAHGLTHLMNEYLSAMTDIIMQRRGLVDKYIGDAIMAFWGAPLPNRDQASDACRAVLEMSRRLRELNIDWQKENIPLIEIGVGINTGEVIVGNMGSRNRFNYTIMGDEVNFCSRLEGLNKAYGTECLISESTQKEIAKEQDLVVRELDLVMVKGKKEPKLIFELVTKPVDDTLKKVLEYFAQGKASYLRGEWDKAIDQFQKALALHEDGPSKTFLERCHLLKIQAPVIWNGVYEFKSK